jgi:ribosomal protein S18 acetylase RimI-like enzyme
VTTIRPCEPPDEQTLYDICLLTGDSGADATALYRDPRILGEVYVGPYLRFPSALALAGVDAEGVAGYVLGVPDTVAFEQWCEQSWWPARRARYPLGAFPDGSPDDRITRLIHTPPTASPDVVERYPAHLHIDLLPRLQGQGDGRRLLTALLDGLASLGAPGIHLGVSLANERAIGFYRRMGFTDVQAYTHSLVMARTL